MDILKEKYLKSDLNFMYNVFKLGNNPARLVGTGSMLSQYFPADFDFLCVVKDAPTYTPTKAFEEFKKVIARLEAQPTLFFIEFKLQKNAEKGKDPEKYKLFNTKDIDNDFFQLNFSNVELCKIDAIVYLKNGLMKEVSCIYFFSNKPLVMADYIQGLLDDQVHYYKEKKYYKSLKRLMLSAKYETPPDKNLMIVITSLFNSSIGRLYELDNEIQACIIYMNKYGEDKRVKLFIRNIGLGNMPGEDLPKVSEAYQHIINSEALKLYKKYKLPVGNLPAFNSIRLGGSLPPNRIGYF